MPVRQQIQTPTPVADIKIETYLQNLYETIISQGSFCLVYGV